MCELSSIYRSRQRKLLLQRYVFLLFVKYLLQQFSWKLAVMHWNDLCTYQLFSFLFLCTDNCSHAHKAGNVDRGNVDTRFYICYPSPNTYIFMQLEIQLLNNSYVKLCVVHWSFFGENPSSHIMSLWANFRTKIKHCVSDSVLYFCRANTALQK